MHVAAYIEELQERITFSVCGLLGALALMDFVEHAAGFFIFPGIALALRRELLLPVGQAIDDASDLPINCRRDHGNPIDEPIGHGFSRGPKTKQV
jgi:hypothetical protein